MKRINKCHGLALVHTTSIDFDNNALCDNRTTYLGTCIKFNGCNMLVLPYISKIKSIKFVTYDKIYNMTLLWSKINTKGKVIKVSKMWNYTLVTLTNDDDITYINYDNAIIKDPHCNILSDIVIENTNIYNNGKCTLKKILINPIHKKLTNIYYYDIDKKNNIEGALIYVSYDYSKKIKFFGFVSGKYVTPFINIYYDNINVNLCLLYTRIPSDIVKNINIIRNTVYPKIISDYKFFKKNDIILEINNETINKCKIFSKKHHCFMDINTYLSYATQERIATCFLILRNKRIREIIVDSSDLHCKFKNKCEIIRKKDFNIFSSDMCDSLIQQNKLCIEIYKYLLNPHYKVKLFFSFDDNVNIN